MYRPRMIALLLLLLVLAACSSGEGSGAAHDTAAQPDRASETGDSDGEVAVAEGPAEDDTAAEDREAGVGGGDVEPGGPLPAAPAALRNPERVIREGTMTVEVPAGEVQAAFGKVVAAARQLGGGSVSATRSTTPDGRTSATVTVRVPVERYDELLTGLDGIGEVRHQDITSTDVTAEHTDLQSRLRHARAQEAFYLGLLEDAQGVQDAIAVKQELDGIQAQIEQVQGRLNVLEDRTSFSTLTVELVEPGAEPVVVADARPTFGGFLSTARDGFVTTVGGMLVVGAGLAPVAVLALLLLTAWRAFARRPRTATVSADSGR